MSSSSSLFPTQYPVLALGSAKSTEVEMDPTTSPSPTSLSTSSSLPPASPFQQAYLGGGLSPPAIVGFVGVGVFTLGLVALCAWRKITGRQVVLPDFIQRRYNAPGGSQRRRQHQRRRGDSHRLKEKPVIFEAWTARRTTDVLKWEQSVPVSATLFTEVVKSGCVPEKVATLRVSGEEDDDEDEGAEEEENENEKQLHVTRESTESRLHVAVLLQMPSPPPPPSRAETHNKVSEEAIERGSVRGDLTIGIMEMPWTREDHCSRKSTASSL